MTLKQCLPAVAVLGALFLSACAPKAPPIKLESLQAQAGQYAVDDLKPVTYKNKNGYGCNVGVLIVAAGDYSPPQTEMVGALFAKYLPGIESRELRLIQLDTYLNQRRLAQSKAGPNMIGMVLAGAVGWLVADAIAESAFNPSPETPLEKLFLDELPAGFPPPGADDVVGCKGKNNGEYYQSRIPGEVSVVVIRLAFEIGAQAYAYRSAYPFNHKTIDPADAQATAMEQTVAAIAARISLPPKSAVKSTQAPETEPVPAPKTVQQSRPAAPAASVPPAPVAIAPPPRVSAAGAQGWQAQNAAYLAKLVGRPGVQCPPGGICYEVITAGSGSTPTDESMVATRYRYTLIDGTEIVSTLDADQPRTVKVRSNLQGIRTALKQVQTGGHYRFYIPPELAYGSRGAGSKIPPHSVLIAEIQLFDGQ